VDRAGEPSVRHVDDPQVAEQVELALVTLEFTKRAARAAIARARARLPPGIDLETMLRAALRECASSSR
jgi:hypothetical protein